MLRENLFSLNPLNATAPEKKTPAPELFGNPTSDALSVERS